MERVQELVESVHSLLPGAGGDAPALIYGSPAFASAFELDDAALASVAVANAAFGVDEVHGSRLAAVFAGEVALDGERLPKWASLSGYYDTADGRRMQLHCNFPHHAAGVVERLGCEPTREAVQAAILGRDPLELEEQLISDGMIAAYLRTFDEWDAHPHAQATAHLPLVTVERISDGPPRSGDVPTRVLDCSRVLAGPVAGQLFAAHGADVLRIDGPHLPSVDMCVMVSGAGKRNASLDLRSPEDAARFRALQADADVWIDAYRPGALAGQGFGLDAVVPGSVVVQLSAFDWVGPWADRRGYDSIVQSTTGIVEEGARAAGRDAPTPLPVQALDYMTGFFAAAAGERLRQHQRVEGGTWLARVSLLRTRNWLVSLGRPTAFEPEPPVVRDDELITMTSGFGAVTMPRPVSGTFLSPPEPLGTHEPAWLPR